MPIFLTHSEDMGVGHTVRQQHEKTALNLFFVVVLKVATSNCKDFKM